MPDGKDIVDRLRRQVELIPGLSPEPPEDDLTGERACEKAVQTGVCGVLETWAGGNVTFEVTELVPYGHIYVKQDLY